MGVLGEYLLSQLMQGQQNRQYQGVLSSLFNAQPQDQVNITPQVSAPPPLLATGQAPTPIAPTATQPGQPMGGDNPQLALRAAQGAYDGPQAPISGPGASRLQGILTALGPNPPPLLLKAAEQQIGQGQPIKLGDKERIVSQGPDGAYKTLVGAAPEQLTPFQRGEQIQGDYNTLDKGSDEIAKAMTPSDVSLGPNAPGLSWQQRQAAQVEQQRKIYEASPAGKAEAAAAEAKARLPFETQLAAERAKAAQDAANAGVTGANGQAIGITGVPKIDAATPGYTSAIIKGTGMTQAAIDLKALDHITGGTEPPQGRTGMAGIQNAAISNRMAEMDPAGNLAKNKTQLRSFSQSLAQQQKYLDTTQRALTTANDTLDALQEWMQKNNVNPNQFPDYNTFSNFLKAKGVDPGVAGGYNAQLATLRAEYSQVLAKGGVRSVETDREAAKLIPAGLAPSQLAQVAERIKVDGMNVTRDAQNQVSKVTGQIDKIRDGNASASYEPPPTGGAALPSGVTEEDIQHTLKLHPETTREKLLQKLGGK